MFIKQCKGKDYDKLPRTITLEDYYYVSTKYDGHYCQIHKKGEEVKFFTSGGKEFTHELIADKLSKIKNMDFVLECEYIADSTGKHGMRGKAAKLTTYRTNFNKGIANVGLGTSKDVFKIFDIISYHPFKNRWELLQDIIQPAIKDIEQLDIVTHYGPYNWTACVLMKRDKIDAGYEGVVLKSPTHMYQPGKRVNTAIKLKSKPTADLKCIGVNEGEGKYVGMIGSLILLGDDGKIVSVGSGLDDHMRSFKEEYYIGKTIEIGYESIKDTYIQPIFKAVR